MCGVFGAIGKNYNLDKVKMLTLLNESRGGHATGFYNGKLLYKKAVGAEEFLKETELKKYLNVKADYILGHTRYGTHGSNTDSKNAHPFLYGDIVGMHNGVINNTYSLEKQLGVRLTVDSEYVFESLSKANNYKEYNKRLEILEGYWGLVWVDLRDYNKVWLSCHNNTIYYFIDNGVLYYSSDEEHLKVVAPMDTEICLVASDTMISVNKRNLRIKEFKLENLSNVVKYDWRKGNRTTTNNNVYNYMHDYESYDDYDYSKNVKDEICSVCNGHTSMLKYNREYNMYMCPDCMEHFSDTSEQVNTELFATCLECGKEIVKGEKYHLVYNQSVCKDCYDKYYSYEDDNLVTETVNGEETIENIK